LRAKGIPNVFAQMDRNSMPRDMLLRGGRKC
jgi:hypothetical protein